MRVLEQEPTDGSNGNVLGTNSDLLLSTRAHSRMPCTRPYEFKKKKPQPGAYPRNFSPYLLTRASSRAVSLSLLDIEHDLVTVQKQLANKFSSIYFEECAVAGNNQYPAAVISTYSFQPVKQRNYHQRVARRCTTTIPLLAPSTEAEEKRQIRAAIKASRLDPARSLAQDSG